MKREVKGWVAKHVVNPLVRRIGRFLPHIGIIEHTGRRSGLTRRTPVGGKIIGDSFVWVSEDGLHADYVKNIKAQPRVRVQVRGTWYEGIAELRPNDDPKKVARSINLFIGPLVRLLGISPLVIHIRLERGTETS